MCWILLFISLIHLAHHVQGNFVIIKTQPDKNNSDVSGNGEDFAIKRIKYKNWSQDLKTVFEKSGEFKIANNHKLHRLNYLGKQFRISCKIEISQRSFSEQYYNILHFTEGTDGDNYRSRIPAVWMQRNGKLLVATAFAKQANKYKALDYSGRNQVINGEKYSFQLLIQQHRVYDPQKYPWNTEYKFEVYINGKNLWSQSFWKPEIVPFIEMYAGDPWYTPVTGWITNFKVETSLY